MIKAVIFLLFPATALLWGPFAFEEFEQPKAFALVAFGCFGAFWVDWRKVFKDKVAFCILLFVISAAISTILSIDVHMSLFGNVKCRSGLLVLASYLIFYLAASEHLIDKKSADKAIDVVIGCSAIIAVYAISQVIGYDFKQWMGTLSHAGYTRPLSLLGHPNFMANYLAMTMPFSIYRMTESSKITEKIKYEVVVLCSIAAIWLSLSRGMIIAATIGVAVYFVHSRVQIKKIVLVFAIVAGIILSSMALIPGFRTNAINRMEALIAPGPARVEYPKAAIRIWKRWPWVGIGTDAYELGFQQQRSPYYWSIESGGSPHRAHNDFLNILATQGIFGALAAMLLTLALLFQIRKSNSPFLSPSVAAITVFYIAGLTSFMIVATGVVFLLSVVFVSNTREAS